MTETALFICSGGNQGGNYLQCRSLFFFLLFFLFCAKTTEMRSWLGTSTPGQKGQTRGSTSACDEDVREEVREVVECFFTDLWWLNGDRPRGPPSKEYFVRVGAHDLLVASYVISYDVSSNPTVVEGESMQSVKKNRHTLVEQWWNSSSGGVDVTNWLDLLNRSVTPPLPRES